MPSDKKSITPSLSNSVEIENKTPRKKTKMWNKHSLSNQRRPSAFLLLYSIAYDRVLKFGIVYTNNMRISERERSLLQPEKSLRKILARVFCLQIAQQKFHITVLYSPSDHNV
jgi:hypothetical protein